MEISRIEMIGELKELEEFLKDQGLKNSEKACCHVRGLVQKDITESKYPRISIKGVMLSLMNHMEGQIVVMENERKKLEGR